MIKTFIKSLKKFDQNFTKFENNEKKLLKCKDKERGRNNFHNLGFY